MRGTEDKMIKIVLLPMDERPCNRRYAEELFSHDDIRIVCPGKLGNKKEPADIQEIVSFLEQECRDADGLVLSMDMLLYGGLVPSRIHHLSGHELTRRMEVVKEIRDRYPGLKIYAWHCIMRCPDYSSDEEEPDYYEQYGAMIHKIGEAVHKSRVDMCDPGEVDRLLRKMDQGALDDYVSRRAMNKAMNLRALDFVEAGVINALVIPQDDSAPFGYAAMDQKEIRAAVVERNLMDKVLIYPGADEVSLTLTARMVNHLRGKKPSVYIRYASEQAKMVIPIYEGNSLENSVKSHVISAGCRICDTMSEADFVLMITAPAYRIREANEQPSLEPGYLTERNLPELLDETVECIRRGKPVVICDNAYGNGGELALIRMLNKLNVLDKIAGYAGWNTSANTLGTALAEGVDFDAHGRSQAHMNFLMERYIEDCGYMSNVRWKIAGLLGKEDVQDGIDLSPFSYTEVGEERGVVSQLIQKELEHYIHTDMSSVSERVQIEDVWMPWRRMFEAGLRVRYQNIRQ